MSNYFDEDLLKFQTLHLSNFFSVTGSIKCD